MTVTIVQDGEAVLGSFAGKLYLLRADGLWRRADGTPTGDCLHLAFERALREHRAKETA